MNEVEVLRWLREVCVDLPGCAEVVTFGNPTFQVDRKTFCVLDRYQGQYCVVFKASPQRQAELVATERYFVAPYNGKHGWTAARLGDDLEPEELEEAILASWRAFAGKRRIAEA
jgi:predicted DNA-binding protein (MmcQ/YjbR family)